MEIRLYFWIKEKKGEIRLLKKEGNTERIEVRFDDKVFFIDATGVFLEDEIMYPSEYMGGFGHKGDPQALKDRPQEYDEYLKFLFSIPLVVQIVLGQWSDTWGKYNFYHEAIALGWDRDRQISFRNISDPKIEDRLRKIVGNAYATLISIRLEGSAINDTYEETIGKAGRFRIEINVVDGGSGKAGFMFYRNDKTMKVYFKNLEVLNSFSNKELDELFIRGMVWAVSMPGVSHPFNFVWANRIVGSGWFPENITSEDVEDLIEYVIEK